MRAIVGRVERFISSDPSPSSAMILPSGKPRAIPKAIDEQSPSVRTRKLPSLDRRAFHSSVTAPAELTTKASPASGASVLRQSNRCISFTHRSPIKDPPHQSALSAARRPRNSLVSNSATGRFESSVKICARRRSEEHTSELQSLAYLVCRLLLEKKKNN